ncbi:septal ring lytic transglycosylase RlpA family protein [Dongshaea marina]|uniref:septal ring lytic transglycosylase RlpA family protein n=1 Tax=Dongshaea marina TaxID=2047966 RepID=UPI000D3E18EA|nr:septal ring lytic transglycosylase RlpA family protein [Dongshaea marina]
MTSRRSLLSSRNRAAVILLIALGGATLSGCSVVEGTYDVVAGTVKGVYYITKGTVTAVYHVGKFTYEVVKAPISWALTNPDLETIDGLPVKEAIRLGKVKDSPYTVKGKKYYPMSVAKAQHYEQTGIASWYGDETLNMKDGHMTANGEAFNPNALSAAHKYLPLPTNVKVTNLANGRSVVVRVNDRGPFPSDHNPDSGKRIIDLSYGAARELGFAKKGTARVRVQTVHLDS